MSSQRWMIRFKNRRAGYWITAGLVCVSSLNLAIQAQTGGSYDLSLTVVASGGGSNSTGGIYSVDGTTGQGAAGVSSTAGNYRNNSGFWAFDTFALTAVTVSVSGHVTTAEGAGISGVTLTLSGSDGTIRTAKTAALGYYEFDGLRFGQIYTINILSKRFTFAESTCIVSPGDEIADFVADRR